MPSYEFNVEVSARGLTRADLREAITTHLDSLRPRGVLAVEVWDVDEASPAYSGLGPTDTFA